MYNYNLLKKYFNLEVQASQIPKREEIDEKYKWNLTDIYKSDEDWEKDFTWIDENIKNYSVFEGKLGNSAEDILACFKFDEEIGRKLERLYLYSMLSKDSDMSLSKYQGMDDRIKSLYTKVTTASSFIRPELLKIEEAKLLQMINSLPELKIYKIKMIY